jgi:hypothetical protein
MITETGASHCSVSIDPVQGQQWMLHQPSAIRRSYVREVLAPSSGAAEDGGG